MKTQICAVAIIGLTTSNFLSARGQAAPGYPPGAAPGLVYPTQPAATTPPSTTAPSGAAAGSSLTFSNNAGATYTVDQLAAQLRNLRSAVDQTLPILTAFNQNFSGAGASQDLTHRIEGLVSGTLSHNGSTSSVLSNLVSSLRGTGKIGGSSATDANTVQDLATLQNDLQPLPSLLQRLNAGSPSAAPNASPITSAPAGSGYNASPTNGVAPAPTPTGRQ